jgi:hypothetical protein
VKSSVPPLPPDVNVTTRTTTIREVLPPGGEKAPLRISPDFFQFVRDIPDKDVGAYMVYLYRVEPGRVQIDHTPGKTFDVPGYGLIPILDQEAIESVVSQDCGGGIFKLICNKRASGEMQAQQSFRIDLPPRQIMPWYIRRGENQVDNKGKIYSSGDATAQVAQTAIATMATQENNATNMAMKMIDTAFTGMEKAANMTNSYQPREDETTKKIHEVLLTRALADPMDQYLKFRQLETTNSNSNSNGVGAFREFIGFMREMGMNFGTSAPAVSAGAEMVRAFPTMISQVVEGIRELRMKAEIDRDTAAIQYRQQQPPPRPGPGAPQVLPATIAPTTPPPPPPSMAQPPPSNGQPTPEFIEMKIVEIMKMPISVEDAAEEAVNFLDKLAGENPSPQQDIVGQLASLGEAGLMTYFQNRPYLKPATMNHARLVDFIRAFLRIHAQDVAEAQAAQFPKPN